MPVWRGGLIKYSVPESRAEIKRYRNVSGDCFAESVRPLVWVLSVVPAEIRYLVNWHRNSIL